MSATRHWMPSLFCAKEHHNEALVSLLEAKNVEEFETLG